MKIGDLVQVNNRSSTALWDKVGIVLGRKRRYEPGKTPLVRVFVEGAEHVFDYYSLDIINETR
jgi:hypothetical protein